MQESEFITKYLKPLTVFNAPALGLQDDVAVIQNNKKSTLIITTDTIAEGIHFFPDDPPKSIAHKLLAVNLSDLASKGATPKYFLMNFSAKFLHRLSASWLDEFFKSLQEMQDLYQIALIGGDTTSNKEQLILSATLIGEVKYKAKIPLRSQAKTNDLVFISGTLGDSYLGYQILAASKNLIPKPLWLDILNHNDVEYLINKYLYPQPRIELGKALLGISNASTDVSDGLIGDLNNICAASGVAGKIKLTPACFSAAGLKVTQNFPSTLKELLIGGDDYELLFTISPKKHDLIESLDNTLGVPINFLGGLVANDEKISAEDLVTVLDFDNNKIDIGPVKRYIHT